MGWKARRSRVSRLEPWIALALCAAVAVAAGTAATRSRSARLPETFGPSWLPLAAAGVAAVGILMRLTGSPQLRLRRALSWSGLLLMLWAAGGLMILARLALERPIRPRIHPRRHLVRLRRTRVRAALPRPQDVVGPRRGLRPQVARSRRLGRLLCALAARRPVAAGGHPVSTPGGHAALAAAPAVAGRRLVDQPRGRYVRTLGLLGVRHRGEQGRRSPMKPPNATAPNACARRLARRPDTNTRSRAAWRHPSRASSLSGRRRHRQQ